MKRLLLSSFLSMLMFGLVAQTTILDFETPATSTTFQYFGSTLEGQLSEPVGNPDPSGINTSDSVGIHVKPAGAQTWAGMFSNPDPATPVDLTTDHQVCIKVYFPAAGNLALKLEGSSDGPNWIRTMEVTEPNTWTELCYDATLPSIEDPFQPAAGHVYPRVVLFFDFGAPGEDKTYYFDDLIVKPGGGASEFDVTFSVDMNEYAGSFTQVYVSGTFNDWSGDANPLADDDGDGVWTATYPLPVGTHEYKFTLDNWAAQEEFSGTETCTVTDPSGQYTNRLLVVDADKDLPTVCFNSCYACGQSVKITIMLGAQHITVSPEGLYIAGGGNFGNPGDYPLNDDDGDGIWTATFERELGFSSYYTFTNGACPDWSCKENIAGQDCANPDHFNDRHMGPIMQDTTIATCFGLCTDNADCGTVEEANVTFQVDMNNYSGSFTTVYVAGSFNGWSGDANPLADDDGDGIWSGTLTLVPGEYEYKFEVDNWSDDEKFNDGDPCTVTDPSGQFVNRYIEVTGDTTVCYLWMSCDACGTTGTEEQFVTDLFELMPTLATDQVRVVFNPQYGTAQANLQVMDISGRILQSHVMTTSGDYRLDVHALPAGLYFVQVLSDDKVATRRFVKQ